MKRFALCAVLIVLLAVSLASPVKKQIHDESNSSESVESSELKNVDNSLSSSEEKLLQKNVAEDDSSGSSEEQPIKNPADKEDANEYTNVVESEEYHFMDNEILKNSNYIKSKRAIDFAPHNGNQLKVKDEGSIKYEKYLKLKRLRRSLESDESNDFQSIPPHILLRNERNADTSEEDSSEEEHTANGVAVAEKNNAAPAEIEPNSADPRRRRRARSTETSEENSSEEDTHSKSHSVDGGKNSDTAPAGTAEEPVKADTAAAETDPKLEGSRRRRNIAVSSEEDSTQDQDINEVFIFSNEKHQNSVEDIENEHLKNTEHGYGTLEETETINENLNSEEDYAQGCGGSNGNRDDDNSNENSNETNKNANAKF